MRRSKVVSLMLFLVMVAFQSCSLFSFSSKNYDCPGELVGSEMRKPSGSSEKRAKSWGDTRSAEIKRAKGKVRESKESKK